MMVEADAEGREEDMEEEQFRTPELRGRKRIVAAKNKSGPAEMVETDSVPDISELREAERANAQTVRAGKDLKGEVGRSSAAAASAQSGEDEEFEETKGEELFAQDKQPHVEAATAVMSKTSKAVTRGEMRDGLWSRSLMQERRMRS